MAPSYAINLTLMQFYTLTSCFRIFAPILFVYYQLNGLSYTEIGTLSSLFFLGMMIFEVPSGTIADRYGRKTTLIISSIIFIFASLVLGLTSTFLFFAIGSFLYGMAEAFLSGSDSALIYDSLKELKQEKTFNVQLGKMWAFRMYGFAASSLCAVLFAMEEIKYTFYITSLFALASALIALQFREPPIHKHLQEKHFFSHMKTAFRKITKHVELRALLIYAVLIGSCVQILFQYIQFFLKDGGLDVEYNGIAYAIYIAFCGISSHYAHLIQDRFGNKFSLTLPAAISLIAYTGLYYYHSLAHVIFFILLVEFVFGFIIPIFGSIYHKFIESHHRATCDSIKSMSVGLGVAVISPVFGWISDMHTYFVSIGVLGIFLLITVIPQLYVLLRSRKI